LYILVMRADDECAFLHLQDDCSVDAMVDLGADERGVHFLELGRLVLWTFVFTHAYMISMVLSGLHDVEHLQIQIMCRCISLWTLCRTGHSMRGKIPMYVGLLLYLFWLVNTSLFGCNTSWRKHSIIMALQCLWDMLLLYGHRGDLMCCGGHKGNKDATAAVILNCRLCYISLTCSTVFGMYNNTSY
jgi:hypothetical protein